MRHNPHSVFVALAATLLAPALHAEEAQDPVFAEHAKTWTTRPEFTSPLVDHLPRSTGIPSPRVVLGHDIGAPRILDHYSDISAYYRALAMLMELAYRLVAEDSPLIAKTRQSMPLRHP